jgi:ubiquinone/menaquinone biosynthesis C-methylase UbiE
VRAVLRSGERDRLVQKLAEHPLAAASVGDMFDGADAVYWTPARVAEIAALADDRAAYAALRAMFAKDNPMESGDRADALADNIVHMVPARFRAPRTYLDYGCANGTITRRVAATLGVAPTHVFGADVVDVGDHRGYSFILLGADAPPHLAAIPDGSIDLITVSMVLHHVRDVDAVLREFARVLSPGGCIVIREHDCTTADFAEFLDVLHGLYSMVWTEPMEDPAFVDTYRAYYRSEREWTALFARHGFGEIAKKYTPSRVAKPKAGAKTKTLARRYTNAVKAFYAVYGGVPPP